MQPDLRETLTKLASNREFTKELVRLIQREVEVNAGQDQLTSEV